MPKFPARIHVLLARQAPIGVVIRRGPSKSVCTMLWNRQTDEFRLGQWLRGRIYERRSDLSPDGKYLIYFAMNGRWKSEVGGSWTAISRAPYLKAICLLAKGDCWHGGGIFTSKRTYWLNDGYGHKNIRDSREVIHDMKYTPPDYYGGECPGVYYLRLQRDGWWHVPDEHTDRRIESSTFEKRIPGGWVLRKRAHAEIGSPPGKGCYWDEHDLEHTRSETIFPFPEWEWAERDGVDW